MSRAGFFGSWKSPRYGSLLTFTRILMACVFLAVLAFDAMVFKSEKLRFALFGFEESWLHVCIVAQIIILVLLGVLAANSYHLFVLRTSQSRVLQRPNGYTDRNWRSFVQD